MKTCKYCRSSLADDAMTCKNCGASLKGSIPTGRTSVPLREKNGGSENSPPVVFLNNGGPNPTELKKQGKNPGCLTIIIAFFLIGGLISTIFPSINNQPNATSTFSNDNPAYTETVTPTEPPIDSNVEKIMVEAELTESEAAAVFSDLKSVGFTSVEKIYDFTSDDTTDGTRKYYSSCNDYEVYITIENQKTKVIQSDDIDLFTSEKGVISQVSERCLSGSEKTYFISHSKEAVSNQLISPATAQYPKDYHWEITRDKDLVLIKAYVDSENIHGALLRSKFRLELSYETKKPSFISINGKTVYGKPHTVKKKKT